MLPLHLKGTSHPHSIVISDYNLFFCGHGVSNGRNQTKNTKAFSGHWMFGKNEIEDGDHITITVTPQWHELDSYNELVKECGVSLVYVDGEEEDVLAYYKSWNHIIGGDLSPFQTTTGQYILTNFPFLMMLL
ncbi:unnamed protein product [Lactuca saligna]|uniref:Uncharacterized protein n=1 Tax=Lactuca saligna TaxID=75948 RepID=A0AA35YC46_LACSI|nr:unnamed protein product [Lactuca saligna]